jgi:Phage integrase, N-terminal SAM-like domain
MSRKALNTRLKMLYRISPSIASTICEYILSEQTECNIKIFTVENKVKALLWLIRFLKLKPFEQMTKQDILSYLNSLRKSPEETLNINGSNNLIILI